MHLHRSNRTEALVERLVEVVARPLRDPLERECIVVQGRGMERWLSMELASRLGAFANAWFPFPRRLLEHAFTAALGADGAAAAARYDPERLAFVIAAVLAEEGDRTPFEPLARYLARGDRAARRVELATRIAETFDRYAAYRPELLLAWDAGRSDGWESALWRSVTGRIGREHGPARARRLLEAAARGPLRLAGFPERVSLFGISTLPPLYVELFATLARSVEVHLFMASPSREYWAHVRSRRERLRAARRSGEEVDPAILHLESGNPLLAENGRLARDFQAIVEQRVDYDEDARDLHVEPGLGSALAVLQSDALALRQRRAGAGSEPPLPLADGDRSIEIHSCHSPMREVEVLRDRLLACFEEMPDLEPRDVIVMTPSIETYAPYVEAALGGGARGEPRIPFRVTDRAVRATDGGIAAFFRVLDVLGRRFAAPEVVDLLELPPVRERFAIDAGEVETIRRWVGRSGIRWGVDAEHRAETGQPPRTENTWRFGLERLFLGFAMPGEREGRLFAGRLPSDAVEGTDADLLGRLAELVETLARFRTAFAADRPVAEGAARLAELADATLRATGGDAAELATLRGAIRALGEAAADAGFGSPVGIRTLRDRLAARLDAELPSSGFLAGGVTVCAMMPMRSIPFRVVCLLGMSDDGFPRAARLPAFDRIARAPRLGDRSPREDDRFLFLEALLAARERLIVTYVGRSVHDDAERPPSVVVSELLDGIDESFSVERGRARDRILVEHPLQAFSRRYFVPGSHEPGARLFGYSSLACSAARSLAAGAPESAVPFLVGPLARDERDVALVALADLLRFFRHPARTLVRRRLGFDLGGDSLRIPEREPFALDALESWAVGDAIVTRLLAGLPEARIHEAVRASGALPPGALGEQAFREALAPARAISEAARALRAGARIDRGLLEHEIAGVRVTGELADLRPEGLVIATFSKAGASQRIDAWIRHLFLCAAAPDGVAPRTRLVARDGDGAVRLAFRAVEDAPARLGTLVRLHLDGAERPLPFLPDAGEAYREALAGGKSAAEARAEVARALGKRPDPYRDLVFPDLAAALAEPSFAAATEAIFAPLEAHLEEDA